MATESSSGLNWEPYEAEILRYYVDQNHTLKETQDHMRTSFGLNARYVSIIGMYTEAYKVKNPPAR